MSIKGYIHYRMDIEDQRGGGIIVYVSVHIGFIPERIDLDIKCENILLKMNHQMAKHFYISTVYLSTNIMTDFKYNFTSDIESLLTEELLIIGDLNIDLKNKTNKNWMKICKKSGLNQLIKESTRITEMSSTLIDHIYANNSSDISNSGVILLKFSDHFMTFVVRKNQVYL